MKFLTFQIIKTRFKQTIFGNFERDMTEQIRMNVELWKRIYMFYGDWHSEKGKLQRYYQFYVA